MPFGPVRRRDDALGIGAGSLDNGLAAEIDRGNLERRIPEIEFGRRSPSYFTHADLPDVATTKRERLPDRANHDDARGSRWRAQRRPS
jgi:hypothetical protein